ncbi:cyclophilin-like domain-containing protein [Dunaliella salina]|uniref:Cyclophilin-like domain-containing protein n=1 Tax=Dunaliella salina TaxID=3046 RepID=A0ABQ7H7D5_DUNSA|nr:cyclophilin-like domain-containing protein [Dunaliella salina]|eukprot:KAF5842764.1 cyclophilin-like domain-containing protein [Dunaliella salina]
MYFIYLHRTGKSIMSSIYNLEPPTKGKVVLHTSLGDLDIELWPKEAPKAVRNFVQLCLEGYYDNTIFHRVIKDYMAQGGDPTGTGTGGDSIYGDMFKDEFHQRLKFNHRGIVACANQNQPHTNLSQFFITLDKCDWLDRKNTIFGKVVGDTIFNLARMNELDVDPDTDRPFEPPIIKDVEVLWNPFEDIVPRFNKKLEQKMEQEKAALIRGEDLPPEERAALERPVKRPKEGEDKAGVAAALSRTREMLGGGKAISSHADGDADGSRDGITAQMQSRVAEARAAKQADRPSKSQEDNEGQEEGEDQEDGEGKAGEKRDIRDERREELEAIRRNKRAYGKTSTAGGHEVVDAELLKPWQLSRETYKQRKRITGSREKSTLERLQAFQSKLSKAQAAAIKADEDQKAEARVAAEAGASEKKGYAGKVDDSIDHKTYMPAAWRVDDYLEGDLLDTSIDELGRHQLNFAQAPGRKDEMARTDDAEDYVVFDPLLEQAKGKFSKSKQGEKKRQNQWAGGANV